MKNQQLWKSADNIKNATLTQLNQFKGIQFCVNNLLQNFVFDSSWAIYNWQWLTEELLIYNHHGRDIRSANCDITALSIRVHAVYGKYHLPMILGPLSGINLGANAPRLIPDTAPRLEGDIPLVLGRPTCYMFIFSVQEHHEAKTYSLHQKFLQ